MQRMTFYNGTQQISYIPDFYIVKKFFLDSTCSGMMLPFHSNHPEPCPSLLIHHWAEWRDGPTTAVAAVQTEAGSREQSVFWELYNED